MKPLLHIAFLLSVSFAVAQSALYNSGNFAVQHNAQIGLHTDFINDANFEPSSGLVGFYGNRPIIVSGNVSPAFWDTEIMADGNVFLQNPILVQNNVNFILGDFLSPTNIPTINLNFMDQGFFTGESNASKVTGFAAINNREVFSFPVGDSEQLRPLTLNSQSAPPLAVCAYFYEDPSNPSSILQAFDTEEKVKDIGTVSDQEFWIVESDVPAQVTISWNSRSALGDIPNATLESIIVVGWNKSSNQWVIIGNSAIGGDLSLGVITSQTFVPSDYAAITFGTLPLPTDTFAVDNPTLGNYFLSPNGDGTNDFLVIDGMEESPNNSLRIFNRYGQKVFEKINYTNEFRGVANTGSMIPNQAAGLPEGVYFYLVTLDDLELEYSGFLFLDK
ncbi:gliding motility-associated C-terminal domain-containing protein [Muricauda sp. 334s03]|uniref:Gliding motility-associated C-terminal domain-containing protein n=1 Tax=Flagellimonas yonaguniensis TaxID=3031325 RepID=A0ABT5XWM1_9FLAO|nr:gliding motility-associated C-terminal domain-containing protein [[Muricauda] yonaguniensis]MDF0715576.1 gliding motility-associated C-terminal domain-containing protein [[Muricauda] yonaguniensis]